MKRVVCRERERVFCHYKVFEYELWLSLYFLIYSSDQTFTIKLFIGCSHPVNRTGSPQDNQTLSKLKRTCQNSSQIYVNPFWSQIYKSVYHSLFLLFQGNAFHRVRTLLSKFSQCLRQGKCSLSLSLSLLLLLLLLCPPWWIPGKPQNRPGSKKSRSVGSIFVVKQMQV